MTTPCGLSTSRAFRSAQVKSSYDACRAIAYEGDKIKTTADLAKLVDKHLKHCTRCCRLPLRCSRPLLPSCLRPWLLERPVCLEADIGVCLCWLLLQTRSRTKRARGDFLASLRRTRALGSCSNSLLGFR